MKKGKGESSAALRGKSNHLSQKRKGNRASHQQFLQRVPTSARREKNKSKASHQQLLRKE
jgi:hypothetical protein